MRKPHDRLVWSVLHRKEQAAAFFRALLPAEVASLLDWSRLRWIPRTLVDDTLRQRSGDLLFDVPLDGAAASILLEHQSGDEGGMPFRFERGIVGVWERRLGHRRRITWLPPIFPVLLHNGPRPWSGPRRLRQLYEPRRAVSRAVARFLPELEFLLIDLPAIDDAVLF